MNKDKPVLPDDEYEVIEPEPEFPTPRIEVNFSELLKLLGGESKKKDEPFDRMIIAANHLLTEHRLRELGWTHSSFNALAFEEANTIIQDIISWSTTEVDKITNKIVEEEGKVHESITGDIKLESEELYKSAEKVLRGLVCVLILEESGKACKA